LHFAYFRRIFMKFNRSMPSLIAAASLAFAALGATGVAQAQDVFWSVGLSSPGVHVGVGSAPPVAMRPAYQPVYVQQNPVYMVPQPVTYMRPAPVYMPPPQYVQAGWQRPDYGHRWHHGHGRHEQQRFEPSRFEGGHEGNGHRR
jgi:hypothetical protein